MRHGQQPAAEVVGRHRHDVGAQLAGVVAPEGQSPAGVHAAQVARRFEVGAPGQRLDDGGVGDPVDAHMPGGQRQHAAVRGQHLRVARRSGIDVQRDAAGEQLHAQGLRRRDALELAAAVDAQRHPCGVDDGTRAGRGRDAVADGQRLPRCGLHPAGTVALKQPDGTPGLDQLRPEHGVGARGRRHRRQPQPRDQAKQQAEQRASRSTCPLHARRPRAQTRCGAAAARAPHFGIRTHRVPPRRAGIPALQRGAARLR